MIGMRLGIGGGSFARWTPKALGTPLVSWFRADKGHSGAATITSLTDQSLVGSVLTGANGPAYAASDANFGGRASVYHDGTNDALTTTGVADTRLNCLHNGLGCTIIALIRPDTGVVGNRGQIIGTYLTTTSNDLGGGLKYEPDQGTLNLVGGNNAAVSINARCALAAAPAASTMLVRAHHGTSLNPDTDFFINGTQGGAGFSRDYTATPSVSNTIGKLAVGAYPNLTAFYKGYWAEILVLNQVATAAQLALLTRYFNTRYSLSLSTV